MIILKFKTAFMIPFSMPHTQYTHLPLNLRPRNIKYNYVGSLLSMETAHMVSYVCLPMALKSYIKTIHRLKLAIVGTSMRKDIANMEVDAILDMTNRVLMKF